MKNWLLFIIICCCNIALSANYPISGGAIKGLVTDSTKESIPGIIISLENTPYNTLTDVSGHFILFNIPPGDYIPKDIYLVQISVDGRLLNKKIVLQ